MAESWWVIIIEFNNHTTMRYAITGYNRVDAKYNAEVRPDFRKFINDRKADIRTIGVIKSIRKYTEIGFIE